MEKKITLVISYYKLFFFCVEVSGISQRSHYNMAKIILLDQLLLHTLTYQNIVHKREQ